MDNTDFIIYTTIVIVSFLVFIVATFSEFSKAARKDL